MVKSMLIITMLVVPISGLMAEELYPFSKAGDSQRYNQLLTEIRCMVCEHQSVNESFAPWSIEVQKFVYQEIGLGKSDIDIKQSLVNKYGERVLFSPRVNGQTMLLWLMPLLLLLVGLTSYYLVRKRWR